MFLTTWGIGVFIYHCPPGRTGLEVFLKVCLCCFPHSKAFRSLCSSYLYYYLLTEIYFCETLTQVCAEPTENQNRVSHLMSFIHFIEPRRRGSSDVCLSDAIFASIKMTFCETKFSSYRLFVEGS